MNIGHPKNRIIDCGTGVRDSNTGIVRGRYLLEWLDGLVLEARWFEQCETHRVKASFINSLRAKYLYIGASLNQYND